MKKYSPSESLVQKAITDWLTAAGIDWHRMHLGPVMRGTPGRPILGKNPLKGFPDIFGFIPATTRGETFYIEVKKDSGRMSPEQKMWRERLERHGALYIEARSVDDVAQAFAKRCG